jgi:hypothetical protein
LTGGDGVTHGLELLWGMSHPVEDFGNDLERLLGAVGSRGVARELLVGQIRVVFERAGGNDDVDVTAAPALGQFGAPGVEQGREVDVTGDTARLEVGEVAGDEEVANLQKGLGAVVEGAFDSRAIFQGDGRERWGVGVKRKGIGRGHEEDCSREQEGAKRGREGSTEWRECSGKKEDGRGGGGGWEVRLDSGHWGAVHC